MGKKICLIVKDSGIKKGFDFGRKTISKKIQRLL